MTTASLTFQTPTKEAETLILNSGMTATDMGDGWTRLEIKKQFADSATGAQIAQNLESLSLAFQMRLNAVAFVGKDQNGKVLHRSADYEPETMENIRSGRRNGTPLIVEMKAFGS